MSFAEEVGIKPGSRWRLRRGQHTGSIVEIEAQTFAGSVKFRNLGGGRSVGTDKHDDEGRIHTRSRAEFLALFEPVNGTTSATGNGNGHVATQPAFRQNNAMRKVKQTMLPDGEVHQLLGGAQPVTNGHYVNPGSSGLSINVELITPDMAQGWLERGGINRKPSERAIMKLVYAIQQGEWDLTGETIKLDREGRIRDGQHRLNAIIRAGVGVPCIVVRGISESAFDKIDTGKSRSMADVLSIHGHVSSTALATAARGLLIIESYGRYEVGRTRLGISPVPSNAQGAAYVDAHPELHDAVRLADTVRKEGRFVGGSGLWAIAFTMFLRRSEEQARVFAKSLVEGANLETGSPILRLRNAYRGGRDWHSTTENRERLLAVIIKAWNSWRRDELIQGLSWHNTGRAAEKFPVAE